MSCISESLTKTIECRGLLRSYLCYCYKGLAHIVQNLSSCYGTRNLGMNRISYSLHIITYHHYLVQRCSLSIKLNIFLKVIFVYATRFELKSQSDIMPVIWNISQEMHILFVVCRVSLWLYTTEFARIFQGFFTDTGKITQWASYQICKITSCACAGNAGHVFPATGFKGNR